MQDRECVEFRHWALPRLHLRGQGFRRAFPDLALRVLAMNHWENMEPTSGLDPLTWSSRVSCSTR